MIDFLVADGMVREPGGGRTHALSCRSVQVAHGLRNRAVELMREWNFGPRLLLVADPETHAALGAFLERALSDKYNVTLYPLPSHPAPDYETAKALSERLVESDLLIAVGSGTINDLCKYAAFLAQKPYITWATALSMNGYLSANASLIRDGVKQTLAAQMPHACLVDLDIVSAAPPRLAQSGLGDTLCRSTAQSDWLLSHLLLETPYDETPYRLLQPYESPLIEHAGGLAEGNETAWSALAASLLMSGIGMTLADGSYPASQGEHMIAHAMEMKHGDSNQHFHGEQIAVTTLTMSALQDRLLATGPEWHAPDNAKAELQEYFGPTRAAILHPEYEKKKRLLEACRNWHRWEEIAAHIQTIRRPTAELKNALIAVGAPTTPEQLGWNAADYKAAIHHAPLTRDRFTFLDLPA